MKESKAVVEKAVRGDLLKPAEAAERLRVSFKTVYSMYVKNELPGHRIRSCLRFDSADIDDYLFFSKFSGVNFKLSAIDKEQIIARIEAQEAFTRSYLEKFIEPRRAPMKQ